jgi:hypothetical protein
MAIVVTNCISASYNRTFRPTYGTVNTIHNGLIAIFRQISVALFGGLTIKLSIPTTRYGELKCLH